MKNNNLVPTPIVNANGVATTVYRKAATNTTDTKRAMPPVEAKVARQLTTKALITNAAVTLGTSKVMAKRLGQKSEELDTDASTAMLNLMDQPDPHGTVKTLLTEKFGSIYGVYQDHDMEVFTQWIKHADKHLHAVDAIVHDLHDPERANYSANQIIAGLYRHDDHGYTDDQFRDIAIITAAVSGVRANDQNLKQDIADSQWSPKNDYYYITSSLILNRITSSHETAAEVLRLITEDHVLTEAELIHRLEDTPRSLVSGVI